MTRRQITAIAACAAVLVAFPVPALAGKVMVVSAKGPTAARYKPGTMIDGSKPIVLAQGDQLIVADEKGTRVFKGAQQISLARTGETKGTWQQLKDFFSTGDRGEGRKAGVASLSPVAGGDDYVCQLTGDCSSVTISDSGTKGFVLRKATPSPARRTGAVRPSSAPPPAPPAPSAPTLIKGATKSEYDCADYGECGAEATSEDPAKVRGMNLAGRFGKKVTEVPATGAPNPSATIAKPNLNARQSERVLAASPRPLPLLPHVISSWKEAATICTPGRTRKLRLDVGAQAAMPTSPASFETKGKATNIPALINAGSRSILVPLTHLPQIDQVQVLTLKWKGRSERIRLFGVDLAAGTPLDVAARLVKAECTNREELLLIKEASLQPQG